MTAFHVVPGMSEHYFLFHTYQHLFLLQPAVLKFPHTPQKKKIIYQVCLEEISLSSTMTQLFEVYQPRGTIDLNKRWTFFVAWCKCVSVQKENSWKSISCIKTILPTIFHGCPYSIFRIKRLDWFQCHFIAIYRRSLRSFLRDLFIYLFCILNWTKREGWTLKMHHQNSITPRKHNDIKFPFPVNFYTWMFSFLWMWGFILQHFNATLIG